MLQLSIQWLDLHLRTRVNYHSTAKLIVALSLLGILIHPAILMLNIFSLLLFVYAEVRWKRQFTRALQGKSFHQLTLLPSSDINQITKSFQSSH